MCIWVGVNSDQFPIELNNICYIRIRDTRFVFRTSLFIYIFRDFNFNMHFLENIENVFLRRILRHWLGIFFFQNVTVCSFDIYKGDVLEFSQGGSWTIAPRHLPRTLAPMDNRLPDNPPPPRQSPPDNRSVHQLRIITAPSITAPPPGEPPGHYA